MKTIEVWVRPSLFITTLLENAAWYEQYLESLNFRIMFAHGNGLIRYFPFYTHAMVIQDNQLILDATGNLDADV